MSRVNKKQFQQMELPMQIDEPKVKAPHQMSPEEFASHPFAVFHSTHLPADKVLDKYERTHPGIHLGTERAASQRHLTTGHVTEDNIYQGPSRGGKPASMHVFHHDPGNRVYTTTDSKANDWYGSLAKSNRNIYYGNESEDKGSLSLVVHNPSRLKSQHDYVAEAIQQGKGDEVHPHTMKLFKQGVLKKGFDTPYWVSKQRVLHGLSDQSLHVYNHYNPNHPKLEFDESSMPSPKHARNFFGNPTMGKDELSSKGPTVEGLKAEIKRRKNERPK